MTCPECAIENRDAANFCRGCGQRLPGRASWKAVWAVVLAVPAAAVTVGSAVLLPSAWEEPDTLGVAGTLAAVAAIAGLLSAWLAVSALRGVASGRVASGAEPAVWALLLVLGSIFSSLVLLHLTVANICSRCYTLRHAIEDRDAGPYPVERVDR